MKLSLNWIREFTDVPLLDKPYLHEVIVGLVVEVKKHPDADKLNIAQIEIGGIQHEIVCGAQNLAAGQKVPVALPGVTLPGDFKIAKRSIRGIESNGMICAEDEIGLTEERQEGIMILDNKWETGTPMSTVLGLEGFSPKALGDLITLRTAEVEGAEIKNNDTIFDIDNKSLTHRPDLWGHYGFAREFSAVLKNPLKPYEPKVEFPDSGEKLTIKITDTKLCRRFTACIISGIKISESPNWLKQKLEAVDINPINNIVDITNYVMLEIGQPMHAYDRKFIGNDTLIIRSAKTGEQVTTLDKKEYKLADNDPLVTNGNELLGLAGIMGGHSSEITDHTTEIILEAANWHPSRVRRSSTRLGIRTDASQRFEKSLDPSLCPVAIKRATELILEICPEAKIISPLVDEIAVATEPIKVELNFERVQSYIGINIEPKQITEILTSLGFIISNESSNGIVIEIPSWRATKDVSIEADLIEEVARIYGYDNIEPILPKLPAEPPMRNFEREGEHRVRAILQGLGATEVYNYSFYGEKDFQNCLLEEDKHFTLKNYLAETQTHLRTSMAPNFLHSIHKNLKNNAEFTIYELGRTYTQVGEFYPAEEKKIIIACVSKAKKADQFYKIKGIAEKLISEFLETHQVAAANSPYVYAHPKQAASLTYGEHEIGQVFNLHPLVKDNFDLGKTNIAIAEINLGPLLHHKKATTKFTEIPKFPDLEFDVSVIVDETKTAAELANAIKAANPELIHAINLFDIYRGENMETGKKALAYKITLRHLERTLTDTEMTEVQEAVFDNLDKIGGKIRGR